MSQQGRTLPLLGPVFVLGLVVELLSGAGTVDSPGLLLATLAAVGSVLPLVLLRQEDAPGTRRVALLAFAASVGLVTLADPEGLSLARELSRAVAWPLLGTLLVDLALDTPDRPTGMPRVGTLRALSRVLSAIAAILGVLAVLPPLPLLGDTLLLPASLVGLGPAVLVAQSLTALVIRIARRRMGSTPESLASNTGALVGLLVAGVAAIALLAMWLLRLETLRSVMFRAVAATGTVALVLGHLAMLDMRRPIHAARTARRVMAATLAAAGLGAVLVGFADRVPREGLPLAVLGAAFLAAGALAFQVASVVLDVFLAPDGGRLLRAVRVAERRVAGARTLEELAQGVLVPLRTAARTYEARALLTTVAPTKEAHIDGAGMPRVEARELAPALSSALMRRPGEVIVLAPLRAVVVRRPDLRPLIEALEHLEALCVVPIAIDGELEGALVVPKGKRRSPLTLEEIAGLERLAKVIAGPLAMSQAEARAHERSVRAQAEVDRLEERIDVLEETLARLRADAHTLKAGRAADRLAAPAIAYSTAMRAVVSRIGEIAGVDAPVQVVAEAGTAVDQIGHLVHAASVVRDGPFVVVDCAAVRPERTLAALLGDDGEHSPHPGWLRLASGGTLLLVDAPALSLEAQAALAEGIASRSARAEGATSSYAVDVRVIAHARIDVGELARVGAFDAELARRLEPLRLDVPPLRERREDVPSLVLLALDRACRTLGREVLGIEDDALAALVAHDWPGNLRELQSVIDRAVLVAEPPRVRLGDLPALGTPAEEAPVEAPEPPPPSFEGTWAEIEVAVLRSAFARAGGNRSEAARLLGLKRTTFLDKCRRAGVDLDAEPGASASG